MKLFFGLLLAVSLFGCEAITTANQRPSIDIKLIGIWKGEYLEEGGMIKSWVQKRNADGTYVIEFRFTETNGIIKHFTESGRWWIQDGLFHEIALPDMKRPDKYKYSFKEKECVNFVLVESNGLIESADNYAFNECLIEDPSSASISESI